MRELYQRYRTLKSKFEPWWTLIGAPLSQEFIFRFIPYQIYIQNNDYWFVGLVSSFFFGLIHWYFGLIITAGTFIVGLIFWWLMVNFGLLAAIIGHIILNSIILIFWRERWFKK